MTDQTTPDIIITKVDEAPELASASLLPIVRSFAAAAGVSIGTRDISLAGRILAAFPEYLREDQRISDDLAILGDLVKTPRGQCRQASQYLGLGAPACRRDPRVAGPRLRRAGFPRSARQ